jgi:cyclic lactone autoinducer peptide
MEVILTSDNTYINLNNKESVVMKKIFNTFLTMFALCISPIVSFAASSATTPLSILFVHQPKIPKSLK